MARYLEVVGNGAATAPPDRLDLSLGVTAVRPDVGAALAHLGARVRALGAALRDAGVGDADLQTTGGSVSEEFTYGPGGEQTPAGFRADQTLQVRLLDPDTVSAVLAAAVDATGDDLRLHHLAWAVADESTLAARARAAAFEDARDKAEQLAALAGGSLGELRRVTEGAGPGAPVVRLAAAKADAGFAVERGECRVEITLTARWTLA